MPEEGARSQHGCHGPALPQVGLAAAACCALQPTTHAQLWSTPAQAALPARRLYSFTPATISLPHAMDRALARLKGGRETFIVKPDASSQVGSWPAPSG